MGGRQRLGPIRLPLPAHPQHLTPQGRKMIGSQRVDEQRLRQIKERSGQISSSYFDVDLTKTGNKLKEKRAVTRRWRSSQPSTSGEGVWGGKGHLCFLYVSSHTYDEGFHTYELWSEFPCCGHSQ